MPHMVLIIPLTILILIFLIGLINAINPKYAWKVFESWKATKEPGVSYFVFRRLAGFFAIIIVLAIFIFTYIMSKQ